MLLNYISNEQPKVLLQQSDTLAVFALGGKIQNSTPMSGLIQLGVTDFSDENSADNSSTTEVWKTDGDLVEVGRSGACHWAESKDFLFTSISLGEEECDDLALASEKAYKELLSFIDQSGHKRIARFWNYISDINQGEGDKERYKLFCSGRLDAFNMNNRQDIRYPSASAVGHHQGGMTVQALSCKVAGQHHSNDRQIDAYEYPRQYGVSSPSFARATTIKIDDEELLFISGTASIIGHETIFQNDLVGQLNTIKENIVHLLEKTNREKGSIKTIRAYVRNADDYAQCMKVLEEHYPNTRKIFFHADICRSDLLVELECFCD